MFLKEHIVRAPKCIRKSLCPMNHATMWSALGMGPGGYNDIRRVGADLAAVLTTCDPRKANIKLLNHLGSGLPSGARRFCVCSIGPGMLEQ